MGCHAPLLDIMTITAYLDFFFVFVFFFTRKKEVKRTFLKLPSPSVLLVGAQRRRGGLSIPTILQSLEARSAPSAGFSHIK